eukprot:Gb_11496 [translate_table: standard]
MLVTTTCEELSLQGWLVLLGGSTGQQADHSGDGREHSNGQPRVIAFRSELLESLQLFIDEWAIMVRYGLCIKFDRVHCVIMDAVLSLILVVRIIMTLLIKRKRALREKRKLRGLEESRSSSEKKEPYMQTWWRPYNSEEKSSVTVTGCTSRTAGTSHAVYEQVRTAGIAGRIVVIYDCSRLYTAQKSRSGAGSYRPNRVHENRGLNSEQTVQICAGRT